LPGGRRAALGTTSVPSLGAGVGAEGSGGYSWEEGRDGDTYAGLKQITFNFQKKLGLNLFRLFVVLIRNFFAVSMRNCTTLKIFNMLNNIKLVLQAHIKYPVPASTKYKFFVKFF
jgi:hypothetical protein